MKRVSILNDVLGPVMRGPSSSHTAGAFRIARIARALLGGEVKEATITFDPEGSYGRVYRDQGADLAFAAGMMDWSLTDERFPDALAAAARTGLNIRFSIEKLEEPDHPNTLDLRLSGRGGKTLTARARSVGGGSVEFTRLEGWPVRLLGRFHETVLEVDAGREARVLELLERDGEAADNGDRTTRKECSLLTFRRRTPLPREALDRLEALPQVRRTWSCEPVFLVLRGEPLFSSAEEMVRMAEKMGATLGKTALAYESALLGLSERKVLEEMGRRFNIMREAVRQGLEASPPKMQLLSPSAGKIFDADARGLLTAGGLHARAGARAMAVMHVNGGMGVVCAAPTAGAAGVLPAVAVTLMEEKGLSLEDTSLALLAAGAIGFVLAKRATFAAETAGCQVEIGAAGAMGAAAVVDAAGGSAQQAADAAAIAFQNTMGSVCDLVQGIVEIPCHTRNAAAASNAFLLADLIRGGYENPIPLDETIDAVYAVGKMLPRELRCTALGGLAQAPSARALKRRR